MSPVEQIKDRLRIGELVSSYVKLERAGVNLKGRCPFHNEKTPSFFVSPERGSFHCFGCGKGGDIFTFMQEIEHIDFKEALHALAERAGVTLSEFDARERGEKSRLRDVMKRAVSLYESYLETHPEIEQYLLERGLTKQSIKTHQLGYAPDGWSNLYSKLRGEFDEALLEKSGLFIRGERGLYDRFRARIMFPIFDAGGDAVGFSGRLLKSDPNQSAGKYINTPATLLYNKSRVLYGLDKAKQTIREKGQCVLVEGNLDVILAQQAGIENTVGVSGTALTTEHMETIARLADKIIILLDADSAGFKASARAVEMSLAHDLDVFVVGLPEGKDPADMVKENSASLAQHVARAERFISFALTRLAARAQGRDLQKQIREFVYPYISSMRNPIERDRAVQLSAEAMQVPSDVVREDLKNSLPPQGMPARKETSAHAPQVTSILSPLQKVYERLRGVYLLVRKKETHEGTTRFIEEEMQRIIGSSLEEQSDPALEFEAESYYTGSDLDRVARELLRLLERERVKEDLTRTLSDIQIAEREGESKKIPELLSRSQELSKKLHELNSN